MITAIGLSPNTQRPDYFATLKILLQPYKWVRGESVIQVENWFKDYFQVKTAVSFNAGRSALLAILDCLQLEKGSEVLIQAFTCVAVPNSIAWAGLKPVFVDIDKSLNMDVADAQKKLSPKTRVVLVQHTFGIPAEIDKISAFCKQNKLILIEDCAHSLGAKYKSRPVGTFGEVAFFSFGRDKVVSSIFGGLVITNNPVLGKKLIEYRDGLADSSIIWICQQLLYPLISLVILSLYDIFGLGKVIHWLVKKCHLLSLPVYQSERQGLRPNNFPQKYPNALAVLLLLQLKRLSQSTQRRQQIATKYFQQLSQTGQTLPDKQTGAIYMRFNLLTRKKDQIKFQAKKKNIFLGNWYSHVIDPKDVNLAKLGYQIGSCPRAEKTASQSLNLPTYPRLTDKQVNQIIKLVKSNSYVGS